jgi:SNF2 family DNA or RNA helicase
LNSASFNLRSYQRLLKAYRKLPDGEQRILQVFAVVYLPANQTELQAALREMARASKADDDWRGLADLMAKPLREKLMELDLLQRHQNKLICHPLLLQTLSREAVARGIYASVASEVQTRWPGQTRRSSYYQTVDPLLAKRQLQHAFYLQRYDEVFKLLGIAARFANIDPVASAPLIEICTSPCDESSISDLPADIIFQVLAPQLYLSPLQLSTVNEPFELLQGLIGRGVLEVSGGIAMVLVEQLLYRGRFDEAEALLAVEAGPTALAQTCRLRCLQGNYAAAIESYRLGLKALRKTTGKRSDYMPGLPAVCYTLSLMQVRDKPHLLLAQKFVQLVEKSRAGDELYWVVRLLGDVVSILQGNLRVEDSELLREGTFGEVPPYLELFRLMAHVWLQAEPSSGLKKLTEYTKAAQKAGWHWYAYEGAQVLEALGKPLSAKLMKQVLECCDSVSLTTLIKPIPAWQRSLLALQELVEVPVAVQLGGETKRARLVWLLDAELGHDLLAPREQKILKNGSWSKGRAVALKRLVEAPEDLDYLTEQDRRVCSHIQREENWGYYRGNYELAREGALRALVGHPLIFWANRPTNAVELVAAEPQLQVQQKQQQLLMQLYPFPGDVIDGDWDAMNCCLIKENEHRVRLVQFSRQHIRIAEILGEDGLTIPVEAKEQVLASINTIAPLLTVHSDIGGGQGGAREVAADSRVHIHLQPAGEGVRLEWYVRPFAHAVLASVPAMIDAGAADGIEAAGASDSKAAGIAAVAEADFGPMFRPGEGGTTVFAEIASEKLQTTRVLDDERRAVDQLLANCQIPAVVSDGECVLDDTEAALETLLKLQESEQDLVLSWPRGQKIRLSRETGVSQMQLSVNKERDWFALEGQLQLDDDRVLEMSQLMALLQASPGRFVQLGGGEVLALTQDLRRRLQSLSAYSHAGNFHPLASEALDDAMQGMALEASEDWHQQLNRLDSVRQLEPMVPSTLQAQLRDYQVEGYAWLARLAHWGAGACLADDMGLGKTVQGLALILSRAGGGPTLILAPTSVCMNWLDEAQRFAPTLRVMRFGEHSDRQAQIDQLQAFDVLVCSYGLLQNEGERLAEVAWHTIVADEAQAIKNPATQRSRVVMALQGDFKMVTTGTPIENHLGELWNLFRFINPGLLGTLKQFNQRFATPIEAQNNREAKQQLKQLIRPFILRRMKSDVLTELPARTEVTLHVELDEQEQVFYEAVRREALKRLAEADEENNPGKQRVKMLAEIMRLRRACCHPRLVMPESTIGSSKLKAFGSVLRELLDSRHKALVFSQFVGHLDILREYLEQQGISYQYLDGSTPVKQRKRAVDAFQNGEGDVFLISLKAGGAGLNLTAADYVIHMDPWWNPAVEDQASDRAHRMGQKRPVTIYRMVAKNTIEEKIVGMHEQKRDLANSLLEGSEMSGKMSVDEMMALINTA